MLCLLNIKIIFDSAQSIPSGTLATMGGRDVVGTARDVGRLSARQMVRKDGAAVLVIMAVGAEVFPVAAV
jgi:hypothetical protein